MSFHLKNEQKNKLLLNLLFPDYPDGHGEEEGNGNKIPQRKETDKSVPLSSGYSYTLLWCRWPDSNRHGVASEGF